MNIAANGDFRICAEQFKGLYDEYIRVGFDREQATSFICASIQGAKHDAKLH